MKDANAKTIAGWSTGRQLGIQDASASVGRDEHDRQALVSGALDRVTRRGRVGVDEGGFLGIGEERPSIRDLHRRLASGEISANDYRERLAILEGKQPPPQRGRG